jgi:hypothetical protein
MWTELMGLVRVKITFENAVPALSVIRDTITQRVGLPLIITEHHGELYELNAKIGFASFPKETLEATVYRSRTVQEHLKQAGVSEMPIAKFVEGANEAPGTKTVYIRWFSGGEPTLVFATILALEALGGRLDNNPCSDKDRREFGKAITTSELIRRRKKVRNRNLRALPLWIVFAPIAILLSAAWICWMICSMPWRIRKLRRAMKAYTPGKPT